MDVHQERIESLLKAAARARKENNPRLAERYLRIVLRLAPDHPGALKLKKQIESDNTLYFSNLLLFLAGLIFLAILWILAPPAGNLNFPRELSSSEPSGSMAYGIAMIALAEGKLQEAAKLLEEAARENPEIPGIEDKLASLYYRLGLEALEQGNKDLAGLWFQKAFTLFPGWKEPAVALAKLTPTPTPTPVPSPTPIPTSKTHKRIEVIISQQKLYAWEGNRLVYKFVCSTGAPSSPTKTGTFSVISKIPMAYSYRWRLKMPYWLGIYRVGDLENGIHALPILPNGQTLWAGYLGRPVSFGCIVLGTEEARLLYDWAEIGTPVEIKP
ncbi:MAG: L,D-transpeptidase family protein [Anaerolineae bacterium]|nr:L,D-transpeptidase family protein [Anaerolineae bacterium]MDW8103157.1 L,D-transpeptidase family protein [Anaerolineae bacterium]